MRVFEPTRVEGAIAAVAATPRRAARRGRSRFAARLLGVALAALLVLPAAMATQPAEAGKKNKTVTKTISSNAGITIPDSGAADPYPSTVNVKAFKKFKKAKIKDVNLTLRGFGHAFPEDVDFLLVHGDRQAVVMSDAGVDVDVNGLTITLDDEASQDLPDGEALQSGTFRPENLTGNDPFIAPAPALNGNSALSAFDGQKADGQWRLFVFDDSAGAGGEITNGWQLEITAKTKKKGK